VGSVSCASAGPREPAARAHAQVADASSLKHNVASRLFFEGAAEEALRFFSGSCYRWFVRTISIRYSRESNSPKRMPISISHPAFGRNSRMLLVLGAVAMTLSAMPRGWAGPLSSSGVFDGKLDSMSEAIRFGQWESYATGYAWHLPQGYQETTRARLNETTWGGGVGRTIRDEDGDRHSVYLMGFADSHRAPQLNLGYAWQRYWRVTRNTALGGGYLAFVFSREDVANHMPMPALLPCASISYRGLEVIGLFVPRVSRDIKGDVVFVYLRVPLGREKLREPRRTWPTAGKVRR
jgi:hypothetical protein